jgi:pimeloyl-ACP methyl ester carboxylesterase
MLRRPVRLPIQRADRPGEPWEIAAWLSVPDHRASDLLLILVHGGFYTHAYWDPPYQPEVYSCVQWAQEQGLATLNIDRLGNGDSSRGPGKDMGMEQQAEALRQIIVQAKAGGIAGQRFARCVVVGHSYGSLTAALMQATHGVADAVVLTGIDGMNAAKISDRPEALTAFLNLYEPVSQAPWYAELAGRCDGDYYFIPSKTRLRMLFRVPPADPALIAVDEAIPGTFSIGEAATMALGANAAGRMTCPVLVQMGQYDGCFYNPKREPDVSRLYAEAKAAAPANFTYPDLIANTGHNLALHPNARDTYAVMAKWLGSALGAD